MTINHREQKLRRIVFFRDLLKYLLVSEGDGAGKYIFGLCFSMGLADTGRPHREPEVGGGGVDELGRQETGGPRSRPAGCFAKSAREWEKDEDNTPSHRLSPLLPKTG